MRDYLGSTQPVFLALRLLCHSCNQSASHGRHIACGPGQPQLCFTEAAETPFVGVCSTHNLTGTYRIITHWQRTETLCTHFSTTTRESAAHSNTSLCPSDGPSPLHTLALVGALIDHHSDFPTRATQLDNGLHSLHQPPQPLHLTNSDAAEDRHRQSALPCWGPGAKKRRARNRDKRDMLQR